MTSISDLMDKAATEELDEAGGFTVTQGDGGFFVTLNGMQHFGPYAARKTANRKAREENAKAGPAATASEPDTSELEAELDGAAFVAKIEGDLAAFKNEAAAEPEPTPKPRREPAAPTSPIVTREDWLLAASVQIESVLADLAELELDKYRVTCGWPSKGGAGGKKRVLGQAWNRAASADDHGEVFISPMEDEPRTVLAILAHELIHIALPVGTGHKAPFVKAARAIGFAAPFTQLNPTDDLWAWADPILASLPAYPHAKLDPSSAEGAPKKQTTRMIKAVCTEDDCGYTARLTRKWIDALGAPICPAHGVMTCEGLDPQDGEDEGEEDQAIAA